MTNEIVVVRTGISRKELKDRYSDNPTKLQELPTGLKTSIRGLSNCAENYAKVEIITEQDFQVKAEY